MKLIGEIFTAEEVLTNDCYAFDDDSISGSKKKSLGLGSYENRSLLKNLGFKWLPDAKLWQVACKTVSGDIDDLKEKGVNVDRGILELSALFWNGEKREVGDGVRIRSKDSYKDTVEFQKVWDDPEYGMVTQISMKESCGMYLDEIRECNEKIEKLSTFLEDSKLIPFRKNAYKRTLASLAFKKELEEKRVIHFDCK